MIDDDITLLNSRVHQADLVAAGLCQRMAVKHNCVLSIADIPTCGSADGGVGCQTYCLKTTLLWIYAVIDNRAISGHARARSLEDFAVKKRAASTIGRGKTS